jgi:hypothetical protein
MMKTIKLMSTAVFVLCIFMVSSVPAFSEESILTKQQLADLIVEKTQIAVPENVKALQGDQYYEGLFNFLAENGLVLFSTATPQSQVSYEEFLAALYIIAGGPEGLPPTEQMAWLADHGYVAEDFMVTENIREGIQNFYDSNNQTWPTKLDDALNGLASPENTFFTAVLTQPVINGWVKNQMIYTSPSTGIPYVYEPQTGRFYPNVGVTIEFAKDIFTNPMAYTGFNKPAGEPGRDKDLLDS